MNLYHDAGVPQSKVGCYICGEYHTGLTLRGLMAFRLAEAEKKMEELAHSMAEQLAAAGASEAEMEKKLLDKEGVRTSWGLLGRFDEHEFWDFMEVNLEELVREGKMEPELAARVERHIEKRREFGQKKLEELNPQAAKLLASHGEVIRNYVKRTRPKEYERYLELQGKNKL